MSDLPAACDKNGDAWQPLLFDIRVEESGNPLQALGIEAGFCRIDALYPVDTRYDLEADEAAHVPYSPELFATMATFIARHSASLLRKPFKVIAVDCDHTLWSGVCGEAGVLDGGSDAGGLPGDGGTPYEGTLAHAAYCAAHGIKLIIGTTGFDAAGKAAIAAAARSHGVVVCDTTPLMTAKSTGRKNRIIGMVRRGGNEAA